MPNSTRSITSSKSKPRPSQPKDHSSRLHDESDPSYYKKHRQRDPRSCWDGHRRYQPGHFTRAHHGQRRRWSFTLGTTGAQLAEARSSQFSKVSEAQLKAHGDMDEPIFQHMLRPGASHHITSRHGSNAETRGLGNALQGRARYVWCCCTAARCPVNIYPSTEAPPPPPSPAAVPASRVLPRHLGSFIGLETDPADRLTRTDLPCAQGAFSPPRGGDRRKVDAGARGLTIAGQVRCDAASLGVPCTNCVAFSIECKIPLPKRKRAQTRSKDSDRYGAVAGVCGLRAETWESVADRSTRTQRAGRTCSRPVARGGDDDHARRDDRWHRVGFASALAGRCHSDDA